MYNYLFTFDICPKSLMIRNQYLFLKLYFKYGSEISKNN